jgi:hypothetical protein
MRRPVLQPGQLPLSARACGAWDFPPVRSAAGEHVRAAEAAFIFLMPPVPGRWVTVPGPGERYAAGPRPLRASSRAAILATAAACELVSGGSVAASAAAHALRPCSRDTRPGSWSGQRSSAFFPCGSASLSACGASGPAGDVPFEGCGTLGESPVGELGVTGLVIGGPTPLHPTRSRNAPASSTATGRWWAGSPPTPACSTTWRTAIFSRRHGNEIHS